MSWQTFLIASILFSSLKSIFHRVVMKQEKSDADAQTIVYGVLIGLFSLFISFFTGGFNLPNIALLFPNLVLMTLLLITAPLLTFKAYQKITAGEVAVFMSTQFLWVMLLS